MRIDILSIFPAYLEPLGLSLPGKAREKVLAFLRDTRQRGERCVLVIHGKGAHSAGGTGVLRGEIAAWLSQGRAQRLDGEAVTEVEVVGGAQRGDRVGPAGGVHPGAVTEEGAAPGLVERGPPLDAVADGVGDDPGVLGEPLGRGALGPAARVLQLLRQVPVVEGEGRLDAGGEQLVHQRPVEVQALLDGGTPAAECVVADGRKGG